MSKISIRFFNDREVRAIWDEENAKWWFSVVILSRLLQKARIRGNTGAFSNPALKSEGIS